MMRVHFLNCMCANLVRFRLAPAGSAQPLGASSAAAVPDRPPSPAWLCSPPTPCGAFRWQEPIHHLYLRAALIQTGLAKYLFLVCREQWCVCRQRPSRVRRRHPVGTRGDGREPGRAASGSSACVRAVRPPPRGASGLARGPLRFRLCRCAGPFRSASSRLCVPPFS